MIKNEKIAEYIRAKTFSKTGDFQSYLNFFVENYDEFEIFLNANSRFSFGNGMKKYERLACHLLHERGITWKDGGKIPSALVRNFFKLARREKEAAAPKRIIPCEKATVFRTFHPSDL
ncbi:hypothetical protein [Noviherbaspirillum pedocola]|uniref:Uncharacterized protein n=1 Tax=Noviherbaspirillum pedocola TaxID=2801341 RepID=A0A934SR14_9BURK|nr:hypothetical protein [Noviherbaspirillum pedocola]MBK4733698.1 hypothetical protein [Noviherbaspirillum pedocola]